MKARDYAGLLLLLAVVAVLVAGPIVYVTLAGSTVNGQVTEKREEIVMPGGDTWDHIFEVSYRYQPPGSPYAEMGSHKVTPEFYRTLHVGSTVPIRYSPQGLVRHIAGFGSFIERAPSFPRLVHGSAYVHQFGEFGLLIAAAFLGFIAYRAKSAPLGFTAAFVGGLFAPVWLLAVSGFFLFPLLFWGSKTRLGKPYSLVLLAAIAISIAAAYWRIPQPTLTPPGPIRHTTAIVRRAQVVSQIWTNTPQTGGAGSEGGQFIRYPFQMVDLEFTPDGAAEAIHVLDRVDLDSVPGLRDGAGVAIEYSASDPQLARISGGTRDYAQQALIYMLEVAFGIGAVVAFVILPITHALGKLFRSSSTLAPVIAQYQNLKGISQLPASDPRRKALEEFLRSRLQG